jgi:SAM-dependent methyltransferase
MGNKKKILREKYENRPCMELSKHFADISSGAIQVPRTDILPDQEFLSQGDDLKEYCNVYKRNMAPFYKHYCASIPFVFEEQCRIGMALLRMARCLPDEQVITFYETDSQDGTSARTLAELASGKVITLTNGLHTVNKKNFEELCRHPFSYFYLGYFCDITPQLIRTLPNSNVFADGFDVIYENVTFQFYDKDRLEQIAHLKKVMKDDGILICLEKLHQIDASEYEKREQVKDERYKSLYFSTTELIWKRSKILSDMKEFQVDYETLISSLKQHFSYVYLLWNSSNFYEMAASNNLQKINDFLSFLPLPFIPKEFNFEGDLIAPRRV